MVIQNSTVVHKDGKPEFKLFHICDLCVSAMKFGKVTLHPPHPVHVGMVKA